EVPATTLDVPPAPYGAMHAQFRMQPVSHQGGPSGSRYRIKARTELNSGPLRWPSVLQAMQLGLANLSAPAPIAVPKAQLAAVKAASPLLSNYDSRVLAQLTAAFPATFKWFSGIGHIANLSLTGQGAASGPYHLYVAVQLDKKGLDARYPEVEQYLERLGDFVSGNFDVDNANGRWINMTFATAKRRIAMNLWVNDDGRPIPSHGGRAVSSAAKQPVPDMLKWKTYANLYFKALGVSVKLSDWRGNWIYQRGDDGMTLDGHFSQVPQVTVTGKALHILPTSWIKALSPVSVEGAVNGFMQVLAGSNDGKGAKLGVAMHAANSGKDSITEASASGTALDNIFVRLGMAMLSRRVLPGADEAAGLRRIVNDGLDAYGKDLQRMAKLTAGSTQVQIPAGCAAR
ncbi:MAG: hypothetical protein L0H29_08975, partial [Sinobacteraceae bacterium]|nr:hypothetical protein [Nevskiaceae bacterium]